MWSICAVIVAVTTLCQANVPADEVKMLPGLEKQPSFRQYSGYLKASGTKHLHYWFVESKNDPANDPVVLWLNGGPGCSSVLGLMTENGPFRVQPDGKTVVESKTSWNEMANVLYLEAPAGVGFSYSDDKNYTTDDNQVAHDNYLALTDFFSKYKEFAKQEFFITGESYGGIYVPTLSTLVLRDSTINFKGMAIGNGLSDWKMNDNSLIYFAYYHGLIGDQTWGELFKYCCSGIINKRCYFTDGKSQQCQQVVNDAAAVVYNAGLNIYNLYGECAGGVFSRKNNVTGMVESSNFGFPFGFLKSVQRDLMFMRNVDSGKLKVDPPCISTGKETKYLNSDVVRTALHIPGGVQPWTACSAEVGAKYVRIYTNMAEQYHLVLKAKKRVLVYNGDIDMACNFLGDEWFVDSLGTKADTGREEWYYKAADGTKQVAGWVKLYSDKQLSLVTVRGAGHMVPTDRPIPALIMFNSFIKGTPLP